MDLSTCYIVRDEQWTALRDETFSYDAVGNRTDRGAATTTGNRLTSFDGNTMTYDADGNMLTRSGPAGSWNFTWNALGQLEAVAKNGVTTSFGYDGLGRRVRKTTNGITTRFLYDGDNIVAQLDAAGQPVLEFSYYPGVDHPHAVRQTSTGRLLYYVTAQPGHVVALVDRNNQIANSYEYTPFGVVLSASEQVAQPFRFGARELDSETGLYYNRARYYDPALGRFISEDPIGLAGGVNQYAYAGNDPVNNTDPTGLECWSILQHIVGDIVCSGGQCVETPGRDYTVTLCNGGGGGNAPSGIGVGGGVGGSVGPSSPKLGQDIHLKALNCGFQTSAAALAAITDFTVGKGIALGYKMGVGVAGKASAMVSRWALHEVGARYAFGSPADATMAKIGRSAAGIVFGTGLWVSTTASSGGDFGWKGFLSNFVPGANFLNAAESAYNVCRP